VGSKITVLGWEIRGNDGLYRKSGMRGGQGGGRGGVCKEGEG